MTAGDATVDEDIDRLQSDTFLLRVVVGDGASVIGQIQHVVTGEKYRFRGLAELGHAIARLQRREGGPDS